MTCKGTVYVVDDDEAVAHSLRMLLESVGLKVEAFPAAQEFLERVEIASTAACVLLDVRMPGMSGLQLQDALKARGVAIPIVFITGHGDVRMAVRAVQAGAVDFIEKPFHDQDLLDSIHKALARDTAQRSSGDERALIVKRIKTLTPRELEVMHLVVEGKQSKVIARMLDISAKTVEFHRARVMEKMHTSSALDLVRIVLMAEQRPVPSGSEKVVPLTRDR
jgi:FixJ family two-component response regulator